MATPPSPPATPLAERGDDALMLLARDGITGAFDALVRRHQSRALRIARRYTGSAAAAKDIAQNTFVEIYRSLPRYRASGRFPGYLHRVLLRQCSLARRTEARHLDPVHRAACAIRLEELAQLSDDRLLERERRARIEHAVAGLGDKLRAVVALRYAGELSYQEIAEVLELPLGTVKSRLFAAVEELRRALAAEEPR
jgi:RNA polymerase sigma-70 factor (ECF subfamily)